MIRYVRNNDAAAITRIYNYYITETDISFETEPVSIEEMHRRINAISPDFPYLVFESEGEIAGYCYAHPWKERAAYRFTLETTVYVEKCKTGKGIGRQLMLELINECKAKGFHALVACITGGNVPSCRMHASLGFHRVSQFSEVGFKHGRLLDVTDYELILQ